MKKIVIPIITLLIGYIAGSYFSFQKIAGLNPPFQKVENTTVTNLLAQENKDLKNKPNSLNSKQTPNGQAKASKEIDSDILPASITPDDFRTAEKARLERLQKSATNSTNRQVEDYEKSGIILSSQQKIELEELNLQRSLEVIDYDLYQKKLRKILGSETYLKYYGDKAFEGNLKRFSRLIELSEQEKLALKDLAYEEVDKNYSREEMTERAKQVLGETYNKFETARAVEEAKQAQENIEVGVVIMTHKLKLDENQQNELRSALAEYSALEQEYKKQVEEKYKDSTDPELNKQRWKEYEENQDLMQSKLKEALQVFLTPEQFAEFEKITRGE